MSALGRAIRGLLVVGACAAAVILWLISDDGVPAPAASVGLPAAPAALPQMWGVEVDARTLALLDRPLLRRLRAARMTLLAAPALSAGQARRLARIAARWRLPAFEPLRMRPRGASAACARLERSRPGTRCGLAARSLGDAALLAAWPAADLVVVRARALRELRRLHRVAGHARLAGVLDLSPRPGAATQWRRASAAAERSSRLDLFVRPAGAAPRRALERFLDLQARLRHGDRSPPSAPGRPRVTAADAAGVTVGWAAARDDDKIAAYGLYVDGRAAGTTRRRSHRFFRRACSSQLLELDAVDRAGNRSAKRPIAVSRVGCEGRRPGAVESPPRHRQPKQGRPASVFLSPTGSDSGECTSTDPCASFDRAYRIAESGEIVEVAAGDYGDQVILADSSKTSREHVLIRPAAGATVTVYGLELGREDSGDAPAHLTIRGIQTAYVTPQEQRPVVVLPGTEDVALEGIDAGNFFIWGGRRITVAGGDWGPCHVRPGASCLNSKIDAGPPGHTTTDVTVDGAFFHDYRFDPSCWQPGADCHFECMFINGSIGTVVRNSRFRDCALYDVFVTLSGGDAARTGHRGLTLENNWFDTPWDEAPANAGRRRPGAVELSWCQNSPHGYRDVLIRHNSFQRDTGISLDIAAGCVFEDVRIIGNLLRHPGGCDPRVTFAYNVWSSSSAADRCSPTDRIAGGAFPYASAASGPGFDFHLGARGAPDDLVPPTAGCPATDIDGQPRPAGGSCDAGADER